jgi:hypothetical protein
MFRGILAALGLVNFGFGVLSLVQPQLVAGWIGFELLRPSAFGEMRAVFGGAVMILGVLFVIASVISRPAPLLGGLMLVFGALSVGRAVSLAVDGWSFYTVVALALEAVTAGVTGYLWANPQALGGGTPAPASDAYEHKVP